MMSRTSLSLLSAAAGVALTLVTMQPRLVFEGSSARAAVGGSTRRIGDALVVMQVAATLVLLEPVNVAVSTGVTPTFRGCHTVR